MQRLFILAIAAKIGIIAGHAVSDTGYIQPQTKNDDLTEQLTGV